MWGSGKDAEDAKKAAAKDEGMFSNWGRSEKAPETAKDEGMFSNWGKDDKAKDTEGLFSNWGKDDKDEKSGFFGNKNEKSGLFGNKDEKSGLFGNKDEKKDGMFSNWGKKDEKKEGMFSNWGNKDEKKDGMFSDWGKKDDDKKEGMFSNWGKKDDDKKDGMFSNWGNKDKDTDRFAGMQPEPPVETKALEAPSSKKSWFGNRDKDKAKDKGVFDDILRRESDPPDKKPGMFDKMLGKDREGPPEKDRSKKPGMFDKMLGKDKESPPEKDRSKKPGMFDKMLGKDEDGKTNRGDKPGLFDGSKKKSKSADDDKEKKPGLMGRMLRVDDDGDVIERDETPPDRSNKLPGFRTIRSSGGSAPDKSSRKKDSYYLQTDVTKRTVVTIPLLILALLALYLSYQYQRAKENSLESGMSGGMVAEYLEYAFPKQSDWCGHPVTKPKHPEVQTSPLGALIVSNTTAFEKVSDDYDKLIKIFPDMTVAPSSHWTTQSGKTALILCITDPLFILIIDLVDKSVTLNTFEEPCSASKEFRDAVEEAIDEDGEVSFALTDDDIKETIPFAVTVNVAKMRAEFVLCKPGPEGCRDPVEFIKKTFEQLDIKAGITDFALVYSDNANSFKSRPKYICEVSKKDIQMCWNPKTYDPVECFNP